MSSHDSDYYRARAEQEREAARDASKRYIAAIHLELARSYEALVDHPELRTGLRLATPQPPGFLREFAS